MDTASCSVSEALGRPFLGDLNFFLPLFVLVMAMSTTSVVVVVDTAVDTDLFFCLVRL